MPKENDIMAIQTVAHIANVSFKDHFLGPDGNNPVNGKIKVHNNTFDVKVTLDKTTLNCSKDVIKAYATRRSTSLRAPSSTGRTPPSPRSILRPGERSLSLPAFWATRPRTRSSRALATRLTPKAPPPRSRSPARPATRSAGST